jgi:hypothetical protein
MASHTVDELGLSSLAVPLKTSTEGIFLARRWGMPRLSLDGISIEAPAFSSVYCYGTPWNGSLGGIQLVL